VSADASYPLRATAITDIGLVRRQNEDRFLCDPTHRVFGVADGVGGLPGGARAAVAAIETIQAFVETTAIDSPEAWHAPVLAAHENVVAVGQVHSPHQGIASTLTCGAIHNHQLILAHVGDSRCLVLREGSAAQVTRDHSAENEHKLDPTFPEPAPRWRGALARCLGQPDALRPDFSVHALKPGDVVCFVTDGITRLVGLTELDALLRADPASPHQRLSRLIDLTYERGAPDNATVVIVEILPAAETP